MTTGKTLALTRRTFVGKVMSLLFNMLSRLVITFLPRSKRLLISWLQPPSAVILEPPKIKSATVSTVSPSIWHEVMGPDDIILVFWMLSCTNVSQTINIANIKNNSNNMFYCTWLYRTSHMLHFFYKLKVHGNPESNKSISAIFPTAFAHFLSLCHILVIFTIFQIFYYCYICYGDLWSVTFYVIIIIGSATNMAINENKLVNKCYIFWLLYQLTIPLSLLLSWGPWDTTILKLGQLVILQWLNERLF